MTSFLIRGAKGIFTGLSGEQARAQGAVRVRDGVIAEVGALAPLPGERIVDAGSCVVTPGLVNTHHHLFQSIIKGVPEGLDAPLAKWLRVVPYTYWDKIDEEALRVSAMIGMAELALSGATTIADHHYIFSDSYDFDPAQVLFDAADQFGVRFVLCRGGATKGRNFDDGRTTPMPTETLEQMLGAIETAARRWNDSGSNSMRRVVMAPTTPTFSLDEGELREMAADCARQRPAPAFASLGDHRLRRVHARQVWHAADPLDRAARLARRGRVVRPPHDRGRKRGARAL